MKSVLGPEQTGGLGAITLHHPPGTFAPSPATRVTLHAIASNRGRLSGTGFEWGCGIGVLAIAAARLEGVERVVGLDLSEPNVRAARDNAVLNGVDDRTLFAVADSFEPNDPEEARLVGGFRGAVDFIIANPPASDTGDGFDFRRRVMREGAAFLRPGGVVLVQALSAYGQQRVKALAAEEYRYEGLARSTELVPLDFTRDQIRWQLAVYLREERRGGHPYEFFPATGAAGPLSAREALDVLRDGGTVCGRWQAHRFTRVT